MLDEIAIKPGIYSEATGRTAVNRYQDGYNVRSYKGRMEKLAGWQRQIATSFQGICRSMLGWTTLSFEHLVGLGTHEKLYLTDSNVFFDITPEDTDGTLGADPFATTNLSTTVLVAHVAHGRNVGDHVDYSGATVVAGLDLNGEHVIDVVPDVDHYSFQAAAAANASTTGGGVAVAYLYEIPAGEQDSVLGVGWGAGGWGTGTWGTPRTSNFLTLARIWSLGNWGEDMFASPVDRPVYIWLASGGTATRAVIITNAPAQNRRVILSPQLRIMVSLGSHDGSNPDPMLVRWCDSEDYTDWTPSAVNLAGDKRLDNGNEIIGGLLSRDEIVIFTDTTLYSMTLSGDDAVFAFNDKGQTTGLAGPNAACDVDGVVYAMGRGQFYTYDGSVKLLPCDVHTKVFGDINIGQAAKVYCARNKNKTGVIWFYPSAGSTECDRAVELNYSDMTWSLYQAPFLRTAMIDEHPFASVPFSAGPTGASDSYLYQEETGVDADGAALPYSMTTWDLETGAYSSVISAGGVGQGEVIQKWTRTIPDFARIVGNHTLTFQGRKYPNGPATIKGPKTFNASSARIDMHIRSRGIRAIIAGNEIGNDIAMGEWRTDDRRQGSR
jgi:hypothetical protein